MPEYVECELHETFNCSICNAASKPKPAPVPDSNPFSASYDGFCRECKDTIAAGEQVVYRTTPDWAGVIHADCA